MNSEEYRQWVLDVVQQGFCKHDGWWFFDLFNSKIGYIGSIELRIIADELDRRNNCKTSAMEVLQ